MKNKNGPRILVLDIETSPIISYTWGLFDQNIALNQVVQDSYVIAWAAKWLGDPDSKIVYMDQRNSKDFSNDKKFLTPIWELLNEADVLLTQNGVRFDEKKLNARFVQQGMKPPAPYKSIDTLKIVKKKFSFLSNKLEHMTKILCKKHQKTKSKKYPGFELWKECLAGNKDAWNEMKAYNIKDVLSLEDLYLQLQAWDHTIDFNLFTDDPEIRCNCGGTHFEKRGFNVSAAGRFQRYQCLDCGKWTSSKKNLLPKEKRASLRKA